MKDMFTRSRPLWVCAVLLGLLTAPTIFRSASSAADVTFGDRYSNAFLPAGQDLGLSRSNALRVPGGSPTQPRFQMGFYGECSAPGKPEGYVTYSPDPASSSKTAQTCFHPASPRPPPP